MTTRTKAELLVEIERLQNRVAELENPPRIGAEFTALLGATFDIVLLTDLQGTLLACNSQLPRIAGKPRKELIGSNPLELLDSETRNLREAKGLEVIKTGKPTRYTDKLGGEYFENSIYPIRDEKGAVARIAVFSRNITARIKAEIALKESELRYRKLFDNAGDGIILMKGYKFVDCNRRSLRLFGCRKKSEIIGRSPWDFSPERQPDGSLSRTGAMAGIDAALEGRTQRFSWMHSSRDGRLFDVEITLSPLEIGDTTYIQSIVRDVTVREEAKRALEDSRHQLSLITEHLPALISYVDRDGLFKFVNRGYEKTFRVPRNRIIGKSMREVLGEKLYTRARPHIRSVLQGQAATFKDSLSYPDGSRKWALVNFVPDLDREGLVLGFFSLIQDISQLMQAEEALRISEDRFKRAAESASDVIYEWTPQSGHIDWFGGIHALLGLKPGTFPGTIEAWLKRIHPEDRDKLAAAVKHHCDSGEPFEYEYRIQHSDGTWLHWIDRASAILDENGRPQRTVGAIRDITVHKRAEIKLQRGLEEKEVLLKEIHHRVKNNLQIISSLLRLQSQTIADVETAEKFRVSRDRVHTMALVHESLYKAPDLSRIPFADYMRNLTSHLSASHPEIRERVRLNLDIDTVYLDIQQAIPCGLIINELVTNALKHAFPDKKPGEVMVSLKRTGEECLEIAVRDQGIGLPELVVPGLTGSLGLQIVFDLIRQMDGKLEIERKNGTGFRILVPMS